MKNHIQMTTKYKKYIWTKFIEYKVLCGEDIQKYIFNRPGINSTDYIYLATEIIRLREQLGSSDGNEWESLLKRLKAVYLA